MTVSTKAAEELKGKLGEYSNEPDDVFRLILDPEGLKIVLDAERQGDQVIQHEGDSILVVASDLSLALAGVTIDCEEGPEGPMLTISG
ncbi:MAG: hypothetical protein SV910_08190 [Chloroflexota bacterium]|nr:hypothetical protein [Chloroflexota bacterium]